MKESMKRVLKEVEKQASEREYQSDGAGRLIIHMTVSDDTDFLSVFAENNTPMIGADVAEYLEENIVGLPVHKQWNLQIFSNCIDKEEQKAYQEGVKEYYLNQYMANKKELHRNTVISVLLAVAGMIALFFTLLIDSIYGNLFWAEIVDIVAWVFVWESVDVFVFRNHELRMQRLRCLKLLEMSVEFFPLKK